jgi:hypothetical protein
VGEGPLPSRAAPRDGHAAEELLLAKSAELECEARGRGHAVMRRDAHVEEADLEATAGSGGGNALSIRAARRSKRDCSSL